jgi:hypothetical protein
VAVEMEAAEDEDVDEVLMVRMPLAEEMEVGPLFMLLLLMLLLHEGGVLMYDGVDVEGE